MEKILEWILQLEEELDKQDDIVSDDLKIIKEKFQNHEVKNKFPDFFVSKIFIRFFLQGIYD
jgi:hypothetical protein